MHPQQIKKYFVFCGYRFASEIVLLSSITTFLALKRFMIHKYSHGQTDELIMILIIIFVTKLGMFYFHLT